MSMSKEMRECRTTPANPHPKERSELAKLSTEVHFCINYRIQHCPLPRLLHASKQTQRLHALITATKEQLKESIRADYEIQKAKILAARKEIT